MADPMRTDTLNRQFAIPGLAQVIPGVGGLPKLVVTDLVQMGPTRRLDWSSER
jgi:hypothetical protein